MIFDWIKNCEDIYTSKHFPNSDAQEKKTMIFQHITLFKFLEEQKGMTREQIKEFWLTTDSPILATIPQDGYDDWVEIEFDKIWQMRLRNSVNFTDDNRRIYNFPIYQEEIDYINSLDCDTWSRKALLLLLSCAKHNKKGILKYNYTTTAWIEKMIDPNHKVRNKMMKLGQLNIKYHLFDFKSYGGKANFIKLTYNKSKGHIAAVVYSPNHMKECLELIQEVKKICPQCGQEFIPSIKNKKIICDNCYHFNKQEKEKQRLKEYRLTLKQQRT